MNIQTIRKEDFFNKFKVKEMDLVNMGLFTQKDIDELSNYQDGLNFTQKISLLPSYLFFALRNPKFISTFVLPKLGFVWNYSHLNRNLALKDQSPIKNCIVKASIAAAYNPKVILEIGTYLGWGAASLKKACPKASVYSINPKENSQANNPIEAQKIGYFYRKKKLKVKQIWADSALFDYHTIPKPDVIYIDGDHSYNAVYKDLDNSSRVVKKCIILDDFIPGNSGLMYGPWNESVVNATHDFLKKTSQVFKEVFWIKGTSYCIMIKK